MTETEYNGYKKYHASVENASDREDFKAKDIQSKSIKHKKNMNRKMDFALRKGNFEIIDEIESDTTKTEKDLRGAQGRIKRKKLIDGFEEN